MHAQYKRRGGLTGSAFRTAKYIGSAALGYAGKQAVGHVVRKSINSVAKSAVKQVKKQRKVNIAVKKEMKKQAPLAKLSRQVKTLQKEARASMGTLTYRITDGLVQTVLANTQGNETMYLNAYAEVEGVLGQLKYYDPAVPAALVTADGTTGSYSKNFLFKPSYMKVTLRNNYQVPCIARVYQLKVKTDTNITPETAWSNGMTDVSNGTVNDIGIYPSDSPQFGDFWAISNQTTIRLEPGQEKRFTISAPQFNYDPSVTDNHTLSYQCDQHARAIMVSICGAIGHDSAVTTEFGKLPAGVDIDLYKVYTVEYDAGANIKYIFLSNGYSTFTNGGLVSNKPVADNQAYSLA